MRKDGTHTRTPATNPLRFVDPDGLEYRVCGAGSSSGCNNVSYEDWNNALRSGRVEERPCGGGWICFYTLVNGKHVHAGWYFDIGPGETDRSPLSRMAGDVARMAKPGVDAALAIGAMYAVTIGGMAAIEQFGSTAVARTIDANKLNHIFGNSAHKLGALVARYGSRESAYNAVERATQAAAAKQGLQGVFEITVKVAM